MRRLRIELTVIACLVAALAPVPAAAQDGFNPFGELETSRPAPKKAAKTEEPKAPALAPMDGTIESGNPSGYGPAPIPGRPADLPPQPGSGAGQQSILREDLPAGPIDEKSRGVVRDELEPVLAGDGSGLPHELWRGLSVGRVEELISTVEIPPRSASLHALFRRLITADVTPPTGGETNTHFTALRIEALDRSGLTKESASVLAREPASSTDPILSVLSARSAIGNGDRERGCATAKGFAAMQAALPERLKAQAILLSAYCAAAGGDMTAAGLQVQLARELGGDAPAGLDALDAIASGGKPKITEGQKVGLIDWRILELAGAVDAAALVSAASPGLLAHLSTADATDPSLTLMAGEMAAALNAISPDDLAQIYRAQQGSPPGDVLASAEPANRAQAALRRALLFKSSEAEQTPTKKARLIRAYLDDARRNGLYWTGLQLMAKPAASLQRTAELGWFSETGIETALAAGDFNSARDWAQSGNTLDRQQGAAGGVAHGHWLALADLADPNLTTGRSQHLATLEGMAAQGRLNSDQLHRLATVLDALDVQVPIPLWEAASRTPQPAGGHLPETGVLSELSEASKKKEFGHTVLVAMKALGPTGAEGAHMIALGDSIRALRRAGLEQDARRLGLEALFATWPRTANN
jgi:hypothetical protein